MSQTSCCSTTAVSTPEAAWITGRLEVNGAKIPVISTELTFADRLGGWRVRWGINRKNYRITPGLYAVGTPDPAAPVLVSANYKLSFDSLRKELSGLNLWILVIDTKGVNVWCAAGKGTFGTKEIIKRIYQTNLPKLVTGRTLIIPQLGAPGVAAHTVTKVTKFKVVYGPVRAADLRAFLEAGMTATQSMRQVRFSMLDRLILTPVELVQSLKYSLAALAVLFVLNLIQPGGLQIGAALNKSVLNFLPYLGAVLIGTVAVPVLLPWIPGRSFAFKGWVVGLLWAIWISYAHTVFGWRILPWPALIAQLLLLPAIASFLALNFTGSSTFTSLSGVKKEMQAAIPALIISSSLGLVLLIVNKVLEFI